MTRRKVTNLVVRVAVVAAVLAGFLFAVQPVAAAGTASIDQIRFPAPPNYLLNNVSTNELFWWKITGTATSTPIEMRHRVIDPDGITIHDQHWDIRGGDITNGIFNVENTVGDAAHGDQTTPQYAHSMPTFPAGSKPGVYISYVDYYSAQISGNANYPVDNQNTFDSESAITFLVRQPLRVFKYNDLNMNGSRQGGEPGLDTWHFSVTGPSGQEWSYTGTVAASPVPSVTQFGSNDLTANFPASGSHLLVNFADVGAYTLSAGVFTVGTMGSAPAPGSPISTVPVTTFEGDTSGGGFLDLPNGVLVAGDYTITETLKANWQNTDPGGAGPTYSKTINVPDDINEQDPTIYFGNVELTPDTQLGMNADPDSFPAGGGTTTLTVTETNNGNLPLHAVNIAVTSNAPSPYDAFTLTNSSFPAGTTFTESIATDGILVKNEVWQWSIPNVPITGTTAFSALGDALDPSGAHVNVATGHDGEQASLPIPVRPPQTPASSNLGMGLLIAALAGIMTLFVYRRLRHSPQS